MTDKLACITGDEGGWRYVFPLAGQRIWPQNIFNTENELILSTINLLRLLILLPWMSGCLMDYSRFPLSTSVVAVFKHVVAGRVKSPKRSFTWSASLPRYFDKTVVQTQIVADRILPSLSIFTVVRKSIHNELVDSVESDFLVGSWLNGHSDQSDVRIRWLLCCCRRWNQF